MVSIPSYNTHIATYDPIATITLTSAQSSVTFSNITQEYSDLHVVVNAIANPANDLIITINNDSGSNYSRTVLYGTGTSASSTRGSNLNIMYCDAYMSLDTSEYSIYTIDFFQYSNTNLYKTSLVSATRAGRGMDKQVNLWRSTSAITSLKFFADTGNLTGGKISLYGIRGEL